MTEIDVLALTVYAEARGEPIEGRIAVACVIRNRVFDGRWGQTYASVCLWPKQFSCWNAGTEANHVKLIALTEQLTAGTLIPDALLEECYWIAEGIITNRIGARVGNSTHYHTIKVDPSWAPTGHLIARVGSQLFYDGVA